MSLLLLVALMVTGAQWPHSPPPDPFGKYLVYSAAGVYDPTVPPEEGDLAEWFHRKIMGRDDEAFEAERAAANAYFKETFGDLYTEWSLNAFGVDPRNEYRAYFISGMRVPPEGWVVRDGGFMAMLPDGGIVVYGDYNIKVTKWGKGGPEPEPIIIHYQSAEPIYPTPKGLMFRCVLRSDSFDDFGGGLAQGISAP